MEVHRVSMVYHHTGGKTHAVEDVSFTVQNQEFLCVLGPSGCGKSTLLHLLAGFIKPTTGDILKDGHFVTGPGVDRGVVFQQHSLFPWKTVWGNVEFGLRVKGVPIDRRREAVLQYIKEMGLQEFINSYPQTLSVGMQQRVGLARAFANDPEILLMDEPFGSLDAQTRLRMQELLLSIWSKNRKTVVFVTHDIEEAILLSDRILLLSRRPAKVRKTISVDISRPRTHTLLTDPRFIQIKKTVMTYLFDE